MYGSAFARKASSTLSLTLHCSATFFQHECGVTKGWQKWSLKGIGWGGYANTHGLPFNLVSQEGHAPVLTRWPLFHTTPVSLGNGFQSLRFTPPPPNPQSWQILSSQKRSDFWKEPNIIWIPGWWIRWRSSPGIPFLVKYKVWCSEPRQIVCGGSDAGSEVNSKAAARTASLEETYSPSRALYPRAVWAVRHKKALSFLQLHFINTYFLKTPLPLNFTFKAVTSLGGLINI